MSFRCNLSYNERLSEGLQSVTSIGFSEKLFRCEVRPIANTKWSGLWQSVDKFMVKSYAWACTDCNSVKQANN